MYEPLTTHYSPADGLDVPLAQVVEHLADVEVLLHRGAEQLEAGVAGELLDLVAENAKQRESESLNRRNILWS